MDDIGIQDLTLLEKIDEEHLTKNLELRYKANKVYTSIGDVVISLNPYKTLNIYGPDTIEAYRGKNIYELPPHLYVHAPGAKALIG
jgi:myosin-1